MNVLLGHLNLLVLANFLSVARHIAANRKIKDKRTGPPLYGILCPDWIKWAGIPKHFIFMSRAGETSTDQTLLCSSDKCWNTELFNSYLNEKISLAAALSLF